MTPRTRWQGWTIVENGNLVLTSFYGPKPILFRSKQEAELAKNQEQKTVRCELRLTKGKP